MATVSPHDLQLHRVPAALLRARSQASQDAPVAGWAASVVGLLDQAAPVNVRFDPGGWPLWRRLLPHVLAAAGREAALDTVPADATRFLDRAVTYLFMRGELQAAVSAPRMRSPTMSGAKNSVTITPTPSPRPASSGCSPPGSRPSTTARSTPRPERPRSRAGPPPARSGSRPPTHWPKPSSGRNTARSKTALVSLQGNAYQVDPLLVGRRVELIFDPFDLTRIQVRLRGVPAGTAIPHRIGRHAHVKARPETPPAPPTPTGIDYARLIDRAHQTQLGAPAPASTTPPSPAAPPDQHRPEQQQRAARTTRPAHRRRRHRRRLTYGALTDGALTDGALTDGALTDGEAVS